MSTRVTPAPMTRSLEDCRLAVQARLAEVRQRLRVQLLVEGLAWAVGAAVVLTGLSLFIDRLLRLDLSARMVLLAFGAAAFGWVAIRRLRNPIFLKLDDLDLAELLERRQKGIGQRLTTVLQLPQLLEQDSSASPSMIRAAVQEDFAALQSMDLQSTFDADRRRNTVIVLAGLVALVSVFCAANPAMAGLWARRWLGGANLRWPQRTYLAVTGLGDADRLAVPAGETVMLQIDAAANFTAAGPAWRLSGRGEPLVVESVVRPTSAQPDNVSIKLVMSDGSQRLGNLTRFGTDQYRYELPPIAKPAEFTITGGDDWFGPIRIVPVDRPSIENLTVVAHTPGKSEPETFRADDAEQQLLFLPTTRLELQFTTTQPLSTAKVVVSGSDAAIELVKMDDRKYQMNWEIKEPVTFEFQLTSQSGGLSSKPHFLTIGILNDRPPRLTLRSTGVGRRVTPVARIPLHLRVMDDYGVAKLALDLEETRIVDQKPTTTNRKPVEESFVESGSNLSTDIEREPTLSLAECNLVPGASVRVRGTAGDACVLGTQTADSRWLSFQIVSADELFYEILTRQREQRAKLAKAIETAKGQVETLGKVTTSAEAGSTVRVHQALARQVWQITGVLNGTLQEMTLNDLGNSAARQLLEKGIVKPLYEFHANPLTELRAKLEAFAATQSLDEDRREAAITSQTQVVEQMQRILDQMSQWESFIDVVNQLRHLISSQEQIRDSTEKTQKEQIKGVFDDP